MRRANATAWTLAEHLAGHRLPTARTAGGMLIACGYPQAACELLSTPMDREALFRMLRSAGFDISAQFDITDLPDDWPERPRWRRCTRTPWGHVDHAERIAEGITLVGTACHGGFVLSRERWDAMPKSLREFSYTRDQHFEEDCAARAVVIAWPEHFTEKQVAEAWGEEGSCDVVCAGDHHAREAMKRWDPDAAREMLRPRTYANGTPSGRAATAEERAALPW